MVAQELHQSCRIQGLNPELPDLLLFEEDNIETTQQPTIVGGHKTTWINNDGGIESEFESEAESEGLIKLKCEPQVSSSGPLPTGNYSFTNYIFTKFELFFNIFHTPIS